MDDCHYDARSGNLGNRSRAPRWGGCEAYPSCFLSQSNGIPDHPRQTVQFRATNLPELIAVRHDLGRARPRS